MLSNYIKIAWKVLLRRKFFTFISLFGISFTLMVVSILVTLFEQRFGNFAPESNFDRFVVVNSIEMRDSTNSSVSTGNPSYHFLETYVKSMESPEAVTIMSNSGPSKIYKDGEKYEFTFRHVDADYWKVLDFTFVRGQAFDQSAMDAASPVAAISEETALSYFGTLDCLDQTMKANKRTYRVIGVFEEVSINRKYAHAHVIAPASILSSTRDKDPSGSFTALILAKEKAHFESIKQEYQKKISHMVWPVDYAYHKLKSKATTPVESMALEIWGEGTNLGKFYLILFGSLFLFMSLPALNLVNINITRIMERRSEIGVRKAFGAHSNHLILQFVVENILLTLIGGIIGLLLSIVVLQLVNNSGFLPKIDLNFNPTIFIFTLVVTLIFGIMSGILPAYKMSKLPVVQALKGEKNDRTSV